MDPGNRLLITTSAEETRIALQEKGQTTEFFLEKRRERSVVGNLYKGRVVRVLPGMQSAFVDIGQERTGFLYITGVQRSDNHGKQASTVDTGSYPIAEVEERQLNIRELLKEGQEVLVQITKESIGTKGPRLTSHVALPGRNIVYLPTVEHLGISRRIEDEAQRQRLRDVASQLDLDGGGIIFRTASENKEMLDFVQDLNFLRQLWREILEQAGRGPTPNLVHQDLDLMLRSARDMLSPSISAIVIDDYDEYNRLLSFVNRFMPQYSSRIQFYDEDAPLFDQYGVDIDISRALDRKVWLKSGGYIIVDEVEALTAVDVNTGKFVGKKDLEDTITKINIEAVKEIAFQMRLRDIGGLIIIDLIDMEQQENQEKVYAALEIALRSDRARTKVLPMSGLGLIEMTRKRVRESLRHQLAEPCFYCDGKGYLKARTVTCSEVLTKIRRILSKPNVDAVEVSAHPMVVELINHMEQVTLAEMEQRFGKSIEFVIKENYHIEEYDIVAIRERKT